MAALDPNIVGTARVPGMRSPMPPRGMDEIAAIASGAPTNVVEFRAKTTQDLVAEDRAKAQAAASMQHVSRLAAWVRSKWDAAKRAKYPHEILMLQDLRQRDGKYDPEDLAVIRRSGGTEIYMMLSATKCRAAQAWIKDTLLTADGHPWAVDPTPIPELPPEIMQGIEQKAMLMLQQDAVAMLQQLGYVDQTVMQQLQEQAMEAMKQVQEQVLQQFVDEARKRADKMEVKIEDQLQEGGFYEALEECIDDLVTYPAAILKGPVVRRRKRLEWVQGQDGATTAQAVETFVTEFKRVSPFDLYPLPQTSDIQKGGFFERQKTTVEELSALIGVPGYDEASIRAVIDEYARGGLREWLAGDAARAVAEGRPHEYLNDVDTIEAVEFWGRVPGTMLLEFGVPAEQVPDRSFSYEANVWLIGHYVVRAALNPHPTGKRPYGIASYEKVPGQIWGKGIPRLIRDCQRMCNAAARALANNMAIASGPQVAIRNTRRIPMGEEVEEMFPWKIWQFLPDERGTGEPPIDFYSPSMFTNELLEVYSYFSRLSDDYSGIIPAAYGSNNAAGAGRTASGQAMLLTNASKVLSGVISNVDRGVIEPVVEMQFVHNMLFDDDESIKGDVFITAKGSAALVVKEQAQMRRNEFLALTNNPVDLQIVGIEGRRAILHEAAKTLQLGRNIVPTEEELQARMMQEQAAAMEAAQMQEQQEPQTATKAGNDAKQLTPPPEGGMA